MAVITYLNFDGNAEQAIEFYTEAFQATHVKKVRFGDIPQNPNYPMPEQERAMIMESSLEFAGGRLMMSDVPPSMKNVTGDIVRGTQLLISIVIDDKAALADYFSNLSVGGHVIMPLSDVPWSSCFGMLVDRFGIVWKFNSDADKFLDRVLSEKNN
ncbi:VOC family protein [Paenibacillus daejeonensis]|uniref:VOC family protein n=1 Tax=Paenibacillus daejeonensis TaxID=135193 RepID=UPI00037641D7|nr:VOC family protein [Paenibacillus daejeonensis]